MPPIIQLQNVYKAYMNGQISQPVLHDISLEMNAGEFVAIVGASGNGKSTLLNLLAGIDKPSQGQVHVCGSALHKLSEEQLSIWRGKNIGIVFQFFQLLPSLSLLQNILLPMDFVAKKPRRERLERAKYLLDMVGLSNQARQLPSQVSGGQQQRAAIASALVNDPQLIVADEPTGNLDEAIALFSNPNVKETVLVKPYQDYLEDFNQAVEKLLSTVPTLCRVLTSYLT